MTDKCPHCDAPVWGTFVHDSDMKIYNCGYITGRNQPESCMRSQIADLQRRLEAWREGKDYFSWSPYKRIQWRNKLKDLGELD